jgi:phosphoribosylformimino-5-aminoimidazole carboxamide ribotide isomerase
MQIIPAIDLKDGRCVRLRQGERNTASYYGDDPFVTAQHFAASGAAIIHVVDLDGAFSGTSTNRLVVERIVKESGVAVQVGGGIRSEQDVEELIDSGVLRVILGTLAAESPATVSRLVDRFGSKICVGIDARDGVVMKQGWEANTNLRALEFALAIAKSGVERIIYTDIKRDGMLTGPNIEQTVALARATGLRVTASGGVSSLTDIEMLRDSKEPRVDSVIVGKALYESRFTLEEALQLTN